MAGEFASIIKRADEANKALDQTIGDIGDDDCRTATELLHDAYRTIPISPAEIAQLASLALKHEHEALEPWMRDLIESLHAGALRLMN